MAYQLTPLELKALQSLADAQGCNGDDFGLVEDAPTVGKNRKAFGALISSLVQKGCFDDAPQDITVNRENTYSQFVLKADALAQARGE